jgi:RNA polymerase sigma factor (sigma-70 family)
MHAVDDLALLREYAVSKSEAAFATLVSRHLSFVYSAALRQVSDPDLAKDVAQVTFIILANKAGKIGDGTVLSGWLFKTVRFAARTQLRGAARRQRWEQEAQMERENLSSVTDDIWAAMAPVLDEALGTLREKDRRAVLLRYFENKTLAQVGEMLAIREDAARKRVTRAVDNLRKFFVKRGVALSVAAIGAVLSTRVVQAVPAGMEEIIAATAVKALPAGGSTWVLLKGTLKLMTYAKVKVVATAACAAVVVAVIAVPAEKMITAPANTAIAQNTTGSTRPAQLPAVSPPLSTPQRSDFSYPGFHSPTQLIFQADAALVRDRLRLTPSAQGKVGAVWRANRESVFAGFDTSFQFQISKPGGHGADGLAFVIQGLPTPSVGLTGEHTGIGGGSNVFGVKFDNYHWHGNNYVKYDEIGVVSGSAPTAKAREPGLVASVSEGVVFSDGKVHSARIIYLPGNLQVFLDDLEQPLLVVRVDLSKMINLDAAGAWVGFTAATGADYQNQDVLNWSYAPANWTTVAGFPRGPEASARKAFAASEESGPPPLSRDPTFGYELPGNIELNYRVEASTDLQHWTPLTNLMFYFKDPESTNFDHRFYTFVPK